MAQEKARRPRAQKQVDETAAKEKATSVVRLRPSKRAATVAAMPAEAIATYAYHLWEHGEPGDATEHWLRAERELAA
jgi:hypothetical protein